VVGAVLLFRGIDWRADLSEERISSLARAHLHAPREIDSAAAVEIKAMSARRCRGLRPDTAPRCVNMLRQLQRLGRSKVNVDDSVETEPRRRLRAASQQFGIEP